MGKLIKGSPASIGLAYAKASRELKKATGYTFRQAKQIPNEMQRQQVLDRWKQIILQQTGLVWEDAKTYAERPDYPNGEDIALDNLQGLFDFVRYLHNNYHPEDDDIFDAKDVIANTSIYSIQEISKQVGLKYYLEEMDKRLSDIDNIITEIQAIVYSGQMSELQGLARALLDRLTNV